MAIQSAKMERDWSSAGCFVWQQKDDPRWDQPEVEPELWSSGNSGCRAAVDRWSHQQQGGYRQIQLEHISLARQTNQVNPAPPPTIFPPFSPTLSFRRESSPSLRRWKQFKQSGRNWRQRLYSRYWPSWPAGNGLVLFVVDSAWVVFGILFIIG